MKLSLTAAESYLGMIRSFRRVVGAGIILLLGSVRVMVAD